MGALWVLPNFFFFLTEAQLQFSSIQLASQRLHFRRRKAFQFILLRRLDWLRVFPSVQQRRLFLRGYIHVRPPANRFAGKCHHHHSRKIPERLACIIRGVLMCRSAVFPSPSFKCLVSHKHYWYPRPPLADAIGGHVALGKNKEATWMVTKFFFFNYYFILRY